MNRAAERPSSGAVPRATPAAGRKRRPTVKLPPAGKKNPSGTAEKPPAYEIVGESEVLTGNDGGEEREAARETAMRRTPSGRLKRKTGRIPRRTPTSGHATLGGRRGREAGAGAGAGTGTGAGGGGKAGEEIGAFHLRGMRLSVKFGLFISVLIIFISLLFGLVVVNLFKSRMSEEILRSGYLQVLALRRVAQRAYADAGGETGRLRNDYPRKEEDLKALRKLVEASSNRVFDVAVLVSKQPTKEPKIRLLTLEGVPEYEILDRLNRGWLEEGVEVRRVNCKTKEGVPVKSLFFWAPAVWDGPDPKAGKNYCSVSLILSERVVAEEINRMTAWIAVFGVIFVGVGIALSLWMTNAITSPVHMLVRDLDIVSRGDLEHQTKARSNDEIGLLATAFNRMTKRLKTAREQERETERLNSELSMAKEIHSQLLPKKLPRLAGYDIETYYESAKEVGGDYYDFIPVGSEHLAVVVADVSGKGIPGSMVMGTTRTIMRLMAVKNLSPANVLSRTNQLVARGLKRGMFVTAMYAILNVRKREMTVASAGHNPMIIWRAASRTNELVRPNGIALGFDKGPIFDRTIREKKVQLQRGDRVLLITDGVVESMNEEHEEWGDEALQNFVMEHAELSSSDFVKELAAALRRHQGSAEQHDDITISTFLVL